MDKGAWHYSPWGHKESDFIQGTYHAHMHYSPPSISSWAVEPGHSLKQYLCKTPWQLELSLCSGLCQADSVDWDLGCVEVRSIKGDKGICSMATGLVFDIIAAEKGVGNTSKNSSMKFLSCAWNFITTYYPAIKYFLLKHARLPSPWTRTLINAEVFKAIHGYDPGIPLTLGGPPVLESWLEAVHSTSVRKLDEKAHLKFKIWWFLSLRTRMGLRGNTSYICLSQFFSRVYLFLHWVSHLTKSIAFLGYNVSSKKAMDTILRNNCYCVLSPVQLFATPWNIPHQAPLSMGFPRQ